MKIRTYIIVVTIATVIAGCTGNYKNFKHGATGTPGEILLVTSDEYWKTEVGDSLRAVFLAYCPSTPMEEYLFNLVQIPKEKFIELNQRHRNILFTAVSPDFSKAELKVKNDPYAIGQIMVSLSAPSIPELVKLISDNRNLLVDIYKKADSERWLSSFEKYKVQPVIDQLTKLYHVKMVIPKSYSLDVKKDDFAWISYETRKYTMGIFIYTYPFTDTNTFSLDYLLNKRDAFLQKYVPGERKGSYMTTERKYDYPQMAIINQKGNYTAAITGLWRMQGDFMGGPFVSRTMVDTLRNRVVTVEGFVYYPNEEVRNYVRQLETLLSTMEITAE
ncbi:MAG TPA: DUF4837 family protein [Bacteroidales bacterium]|nr:DUF4837 family protein [Bacteroidales bacterium]